MSRGAAAALPAKGPMTTPLHNLYNLINNELMKSGKDSSVPANTICSPFNISTCLAMLADGASGKSREELVNFFGFAPPSDNFKISLQGNELKTFRELLGGKTSLASMVKTASAIFVGKELVPAYVKGCQDNYHSLIKKIDVTDPAKSAAEINGFVAEKTENNITDLVPPSAINARTVAILVAALFFKGKWKDPFPKNETSDREFFINDTITKKVPTMHHKLKNKVAVLDRTNVITISIPYEGDELCFVAEIHESLKSLPPSNIDNILECANGFGRDEVVVYLPKFRARSEIVLNDLMQKNNLTTIFNASACAKDFLHTLANEQIYVSTVIHKAMVEVDEEGTVAAAATAVVLKGRSVRPAPKIVDLCRPFHFHIVDKKNGTILFSGSVTDPSIVAE